MQLLNPLALLGALLAIPIILMYMLRLRRREVLVSSTLLWQQLMRDQEANTPWQRLRRNLLLLLQLLLLAALVFALARPFITVPAVGAGQIVLLIDASASMNATDTGGHTRFEAAREQALAAVSALNAGDSMTLIRVGDTPQIVASATGDKLILTQALQAMQPGVTLADWPGALRVALGSASGAESFDLVIISDGGLGEAALLPDVPGTVTYLPVGESAQNVAITALATRARAGQPPQLFTQMTNYGPQAVEVIYSLYVNDILFSSEFYTIPAADELSLVSDDLPADAVVVSARLSLPASATVPDYLPDDNEAWAVISEQSSRTALIMSEGNRFLEQVLRSLPQVTGFRGDLQRGLPAQPYDLYIFDGWLPETLPAGDMLIINPPRSTALFTVGDALSSPDTITMQRDDPRLQFVDFESVSIRTYRQVTDAAWADTLIRTTDGPLLLAGEADGRQVAILTFDLHDSDLPLHISWPVLMANLLELYVPQQMISNTTLRAGEVAVLEPPLGAESLHITLPDGTSQILPRDGETLVFSQTQQPGVYKVAAQPVSIDVEPALFTVNLFAPVESDITPQVSLTLGQTTVSPGIHEESGQWELWPWVVLVALALLLLEWVIYQRRRQVAGVFGWPRLRQEGR